MASFTFKFITILSLIIGTFGPALVEAQNCAGSNRPVDFCCMGSGPIPWSSNSWVWGNQCGYYPTDPSSLTGGRCTSRSTFSDGRCPSTTYQTCCAGRWPGPSGQCALGTDCGTPIFPSTTSSAATPTFTPEVVPVGWTRTYDCAVDFPERVLTNVKTYQSGSLTVTECINQCVFRGSTYAGLEYGNECHCGDGYNGTPTATTISECNVPCTGDSQNRCGGPWRIQLYKKDSAP